MAKIFTYQNGLRIIVENMPYTRSVAVGVWVGAGCCYETQNTNGISHFIEHMLFKGTKTRNSFELADSFEKLGANVNAFTGKECTCYYYKAVDEYNEKAFELLADLFHNSIFDAQEMAREKGVVQEEIRMVEDSPEDICFDLLAQSVFGNSALGQNILGSEKNIQSFTDVDIKNYMKTYYCANNVVISFAGNINLDQAKQLTDKYFIDGFDSHCKQILYPKITQNKQSFLIKEKDFEQANLALRFPSYPINHCKAPSISILNFILGAGMSSRLFQTLREKMGLAYSVYSAPAAYKTEGSFIVFCNINPINAQKAAIALREQIEKLTKEGICEAEFERAKTQIKASFVFGQESAQSTMNALGKLLLTADTIFDPDQKIAEINATTKDAVMDTARQILDFQNICGAYVGKNCGVDLKDLFAK